MARKNSINDLILICYLPIADAVEIPNLAKEASIAIKKAIPESRIIVIPTKEENGRVECINPKLVDQKEWDSIKEKINFAENAVKKIIDNG